MQARVAEETESYVGIPPMFANNAATAGVKETTAAAAGPNAGPNAPALAAAQEAQVHAMLHLYPHVC
jgi:hypothetical protein